MSTRSSRALVGGLAAVGLVLATPVMASAAPKPPSTPQEWSNVVVSPFNLEVDGPRVLVADGGNADLDIDGSVGALQPDGSVTPVVPDVPGASGVAVRGNWLAYTSTVSEGFINVESGLNIRTPNGQTIYADTMAYEVANNPDQVNTYGVTDPLPGSCAAEVGLGAYMGAIDSHAYSVAAYAGGWVVADAGANDLLRIDNAGNISTLAVLPPQPSVITAEAAAAFGLPPCVVGDTYYFEPVPTDVETGTDGYLYVTTLPGGPEGPELGARGALWRVDPKTGAAEQLAGGFAGATNLAVGKGGVIYVAELFGGRISAVQAGTASTFVELPAVVSVETGANGTVWAATLTGSVVSISNGKVKIQGKLP